MRKFLLSLFIAVAVAGIFPDAVAKGGSHGGGGHASSGGKSVHVNGYYRANGTYVEGYWRSAPGAAGGSDVLGPNDALPAFAAEQMTIPVSKKNAEQPKLICEFKSVMTDEEIALCRQ